jgi:hypothetical protein
MNTYKRHRFPPDIISYAVWLYYRFNLRRAVDRMGKFLMCISRRSEMVLLQNAFSTGYYAVIAVNHERS